MHIFLLTKVIFKESLVVSANIKHNWKYLQKINIGQLYIHTYIHIYIYIYLSVCI